MPARILIIDDSPTNMKLMDYLLNAYGYVPLRATDGEQGVEIAQRELPDLILCDIHLPKLDGYEVLRRLKNDPAFRLIPVIAATASGMAGDREAALVAGFDGYLEKTFEPEHFINRVEAFLRTDLRSQERNEHGHHPGR